MRIKRGIVAHRKHKKLLFSVKGYRMTKHKLVKVAKEASLHAGQYAYSGRKQKKSNFRKLWITRIGEAVKKAGISYNVFISKLKKANITVDRKTLNYLIQNDNEVFLKIVEKVKTS
jgi:large subunit ribosomal protein L20